MEKRQIFSEQISQVGSLKWSVPMWSELRTSTVSSCKLRKTNQLRTSRPRRWLHATIFGCNSVLMLMLTLVWMFVCQSAAWSTLKNKRIHKRIHMFSRCSQLTARCYSHWTFNCIVGRNGKGLKRENDSWIERRAEKGLRSSVRVPG